MRSCLTVASSIARSSWKPARLRLWAAAPPGEAAERAYSDFEDTVELMRLYVGLPEKWESTFTGSFASLLAPHERLALPGFAKQVLWIGSDATMERFAATRTHDGQGVAVPSQRRYVRYFARSLAR